MTRVRHARVLGTKLRKHKMMYILLVYIHIYILGRFAASCGIALRGMPPTPCPTIEEDFASCLYVRTFVWLLV